jgi:hypothetical protein
MKLYFYFAYLFVVVDRDRNRGRALVNTVMHYMTIEFHKRRDIS